MSTPDTKNHKFNAKGDWEFTSKPVTAKELKQLRKEAKELAKKKSVDAINWRSCWQCNGAHTHLLTGAWGEWILNCIECSKYYYKKVDITEYEDTKEDVQPPIYCTVN